MSILFFLGQFTSLAQVKITLSNTAKDNVINASTGIVLVRTGKELYGISPESKTIIWKNESLGKVDLDSYYGIPFTPLAIFEGKPVVNSKLLSNTVNAKGTSRIMMNVTTGKVLFDSEKVGFKSVNRTLLIPGQKAILVDGIKDKKLAVALFDHKDQKMRWQNDLTNATFFKNLKGTLFQKEKILLDKNQNVFWLRNNHLLNMNGTTGEIIYQKENIESIAIDPKKEVVYLFTRANEGEKLMRFTEVMAYSTNGMKPLWKKAARIRGAIKEMVFDGSKLVAVTSTGFNILHESGQKQWAEMEALPLIKKIVPVETGFLVIQEKFLSHIDEKGKKKWQKPIKISLSNDERPVHLFEKGSEALYITPSRANKINITNGEKHWDDIILSDADFLSRNLKLKVPPYRIWHDSIRAQFAVYSKNDLYLLNHESKTTPTPVHSFDFGRFLPNIKMGEFGYFLDHDNKYFLFDGKGHLVYEKNYPSNTKSSIFGETFYYLKRGLGAYRAATNFIYSQAVENVGSAVASGNLGFLTGFGSSIYGSYQVYQNPERIISNLDELGFSSGLETVFKRIQKGKESKNAILIVAPNEDETVAVIRLDIPSGKEEKLKQLDRDASFVIDQVENIIYSFDKKEITIERL
ncbi:PQQ-binding-like beta-propeller repeat protein [Allomuricauda sp. SCSIO 65647]|uniref:PQQ-binding-like beta-propeller repeat protein n=1 Tax=Allomuricauda sp. SCSIO 65647 TaxID=2908843 RepID=UPI001F1D221A|nr:PQQ-binding-like beta-propeller repeat protein [Muricauda sp. SCSIO 65647]UJH68835.1 PQQ-binding-like beta-propeller repeat protein [Muricauda sp. SCSIO 65647]